MIAIYILIKLMLYTAICAAAVTILKLNVKNRWSFGFKWGLARFIIGLAAGFLIVFLLAASSKVIDSVIIGYFLVFGLARYLEWLLLAFFISKKHQIRFDKPTQIWIILGVLSSMLMDGIVHYFDMLGNIKFFC